MDNDITEDRDRVKALGEVFTPTSLVEMVLDSIEQQDPTAFTNPDNTFIDSMCGDGQFLVAIKERTQSIDNIYGIELSPDNVAICQNRLGRPGFANVVCADSLGDTFSNKIFQKITE